MLSILQAAGWPIWPLLLCSVVAVALIVERTISLSAKNVTPAGLLEEVRTASLNGLPERTVVDHLAAHSALGEVLASALYALLERPRLSETDLRSAVESCGKKVAHGLERYLSALATIASAAPLLGLLGTVVGMIEIFAAQSQSGGGNPVQMAQGISIALYNTAFGLVVAVPALIAWRYFRSRVDDLILTIETDAESLVRHLLAQREQAGDRP